MQNNEEISSEPGLTLKGGYDEEQRNEKPDKVEVEEDERERGFYLHPEVFNQPEERGILWADQPDRMRQMKQRREEEKRRTPVSKPKRITDSHETSLWPGIRRLRSITCGNHTASKR
jgi:hypothetical protein